MPYLPTAQSFLEQSTLLIAARPSTARITTKYNIPHSNPPSHPYKPSSPESKPPRATPPPSDLPPHDQKPSQRDAKKQALLTLKCYDPQSGTCLKYRTDKAAEVGRLVAALGGCGRIMAGLPAKKQEEVKVEGGTEIDGNGGGKPTAESKSRDTGREGPKDGKMQTQKGGDGGGGGAGKKKKKGKR